jgi:hypothetical protein
MRDAEPIIPSLPAGATLAVRSEDVTRAAPTVPGISGGTDLHRRTQAVVGIRGRRFVVELSDVTGLRLTRLAPARGGGGALLDLAFADRYASDRKLRHRSLFTCAAESGLDELARDIAVRIGTTLTIEQGLDD